MGTPYCPYECPTVLANNCGEDSLADHRCHICKVTGALLAHTPLPTHPAGIGANGWENTGAHNWRNQIVDATGFRDDACRLNEPNGTERSATTDSQQHQPPTHGAQVAMYPLRLCIVECRCSSRIPGFSHASAEALGTLTRFQTLVREPYETHGPDT